MVEKMVDDGVEPKLAITEAYVETSVDVESTDYY